MNVLKWNIIFQGYNITSTIHLHACENPPYVEFEVDVPKLDINGIKRRITHNDSIPLTSNFFLFYYNLFEIFHILFNDLYLFYLFN